MENKSPPLTRDQRQQLGVSKWIKSGCRASLVWSTGVGKTRGAILAIKAFLSKNQNKKIVVIVPTESLKVQWMQELNKFGLFHEVSVEIINSAIKRDIQIDFVILDEIHRYLGDSFIQIFEKRAPKLILGLSATFHRLDGKHKLLDKYCPVCDTITVKEALDNGWLSPYREYKVLINPPDINEYREINQQFIESFSIFDFNFETAMNCLTDVFYRRRYAKKIGISAKDIDAVVFTWNRTLKARKAFVMEHPIKAEITRKILTNRPNSKAITFSATKKQAEKIGGGFVIHSGKTKKKNQISIDEFSKLKTGVAHTVKSMDQGNDIPGLNLAIILCGDSSSTRKTQRVGRVIRKEEGKIAEIFTLVIKGTMEENWYSTSNVGKEYIEITERELDDILGGKTSENLVQEGKETDLLFRL